MRSLRAKKIQVRVYELKNVLRERKLEDVTKYVPSKISFYFLAFESAKKECVLTFKRDSRQIH